jgi:hypothetical protein
MTLHAVTNYDFIANPVLFTSNSAGTVNITATSYGAALNASGKRLWDQSSLPLSSTNTLLNGQSVNIPFIATNLPTEYFDAIILLTVDGITRLPYAFSNSPDNTDPTTLVSNKILYWADLYCFGLNNNAGNNNTANNYMFGGIQSQNEQGIAYKINFSEPLAAPLNYSWQIRYISYSLGLNPYVLSGNVNVPIGALSSTYFSGNIITAFNSNGGGIPYLTAGYYEVTFVVVDTNYRSMLKKYHFGVA